MSDSRLEIVLAAKDLTAQVFAGVENRATALFSRINSLQGAVLGLAGVGGIGAVASGFLDTARAFERYETQLKTITGSSQAARASMDWIVEFTRTTPYELDQVTGAFVKLQAYGLDGTKWMRTLGDTASAMGQGLDQAVEMFADAVTGEFERLKEFGVKASSEGDRVTFRWSQSGRDMQLTTEKTATGISNALGRIFSRFTGGMEEQAKTFDGILSNLGDTWTSIERSFMEAGLFDELKKQLADVNDAAGRWLVTNREFIALQVPAYIKSITDSTATLVGIYQALPSELVGAAGYGILGRIIFGAGGGQKLAQFYIFNEGLKQFGMDVRSIVDDYKELSEHLRFIWETVSGAREWTTGRLKDIDERASEAYFRGREMAEYGGARSYTFPAPTSRAGALAAAAGESTAADIAQVDEALDKYFGKILDRQDTVIKEMKELNASYWKALAEVQGDYKVDPERAREEGGRGQEEYAKRLMKQNIDGMKEMEAAADRASWGMKNAFSDFFNFTTEHFLSLEDLALQVADSITRAMADALASTVVKSLSGGGGGGAGGFFGTLFGGVLSLFSAQGNVFERGDLVPFARGGIVSRPTVFPFARGIGLMGEAGPEAIMPLARAPGGELGVRSQGGGGTFNYVSIHAVDAKSFDDMLRSGRARIEDIVGSALRRNTGLRHTMRGTL